MGSRLEPFLCGLDVDLCSAVNQFVEMVMRLKIDGVLDENGFQVPDLMICDILVNVRFILPETQQNLPASSTPVSPGARTTL